MPGFRLHQGRPAKVANAGRGGLRAAVGPLLLCAVAIEGSACAMQPVNSASVNCSIEQSNKLPPELRQEGAICGPISRAVEAAAAGSTLSAGSVSVKVKAISAYLLTATVTVDGAELPEQKLGSSDRALTPASIERFAAGVARQLDEFAASRR